MPEQQYPEPISGALIFNQKNKLFLMRSHKWKHKYVMPGGHVELGERLEDALKREVKEETGLDIHSISFLGFKESVFDEDYWKKRHFIIFDFECKTNSIKVKLNSEGQEYAWVTIGEALKLPIEPHTKEAIEMYMESHKK